MSDSSAKQNNSSLPLEQIYGDTHSLINIFYWFIALITLTLVSGIFILMSTRNVFNAAVLAVSILPVLACLYFVRRAKLEIAAVFLSIILITAITITATRGLGIHHIGILGYPPILIIASLATRKWTMVLITLYNILCAGWLVFGELIGAYTPGTLVRSVAGDFFSVLVILISTAVIVRMITETLFQQSRELQRELRERKLTEEHVHQQAARAEALASLSHLLTQAGLDLQLLLDTVVERCANLIGDGASIFLYSPESEYLQLASVFNPDPQAMEIVHAELLARPIHWDEGAYLRVLKEFQPVLIPFITPDQLIERSLPERREFYRKLPFHSVMLAPLLVRGRILGVIGMARHTPGRDYTTEDLAFLQDIADRSALAMLNAQLYKEAEQELLERKQVEETLRQFKTIMDDSNDAIFIIDSNTSRYQYFNKRARLLLGYSREELGHMGVLDIATHLTSLEVWPQRVEMVRANNGLIFETGYRRKDGSTIPVEVSAKLLDYGGTETIVAFARDITERKRAEQERERLIHELEAKNTELTQFTYTVSHDLRSPLVTINGFLGYLEKDTASGDMERVRLDRQRIQDAVNRMQNLLTELLELSRIGRMMNAPETIPLGELVRDALELVHGRLTARGVTVQTQPNLSAVYGDRQRLTEVLQNLLDNAASYMGDQANPCIEVGQRAAAADNMPVFFVKDNGIGIEPEHHERIFGLFNKLDPRSEGTGIGLAIVKKIVEVHSGRIWVESEVGRGSTFCFTLGKPQAA